MIGGFEIVPLPNGVKSVNRKPSTANTYDLTHLPIKAKAVIGTDQNNSHQEHNKKYRIIKKSTNRQILKSSSPVGESQLKTLHEWGSGSSSQSHFFYLLLQAKPDITPNRMVPFLHCSVTFAL